MRGLRFPMSLALIGGVSLSLGVVAAATAHSVASPSKQVHRAIAPPGSSVRPRPGVSQEQVLYSFKGTPDASNPAGGLLLDASGALFGAAPSGGTTGAGAVFKLTPSGSGYAESVLYSFQGGSDGASPRGGVVADAKGALYGTTYSAGANNMGTVFKLTLAGSVYTESIIYAFHGSDGANPTAGLFVGKGGTLYGTTSNGGASGAGSVFKLTPSGSAYIETLLYSFRGTPDGQGPLGRVFTDANGDVYGTTAQGGLHGVGTAFKLTPSGSFYTESVVSLPRIDGENPTCHLTRDATGALYGTAPGRTKGTVFKLTPSASTYTLGVVYNFGKVPDGNKPFDGVTIDKTGNLLGTTYQGGANGWGTVFKLALSGTTYSESVLYSFRNGNGDGAYPSSGLLLSRAGALYGETSLGGVNNNHGTVYKLIP